MTLDTTIPVKRLAVKLLADGLALIYHEARHARHLVRASYISAAGWERVLSLPANRVEAWRAVQSVREAAGDAQTASEAAECFERRFKSSVADLEELFANDHWRHAAAVGGHAWRGVTAAVAELRDAIQREETNEIEIAAQSLVAARHNNGAVRQKSGTSTLSSEFRPETGGSVRVLGRNVGRKHRSKRQNIAAPILHPPSPGHQSHAASPFKP